jgi:hypothetical protein
MSWNLKSCWEGVGRSPLSRNRSCIILLCWSRCCRIRNMMIQLRFRREKNGASSYPMAKTVSAKNKFFYILMRLCLQQGKLCGSGSTALVGAVIRCGSGSDSGNAFLVCILRNNEDWNTKGISEKICYKSKTVFRLSSRIKQMHLFSRKVISCKYAHFVKFCILIAENVVKKKGPVFMSTYSTYNI